MLSPYPPGEFDVDRDCRAEACGLAYAGGADCGGLRDRIDCIRSAFGARTIPDPAVARSRMGPRRVLARARVAEPAVGCGATVRRRDRGSLRPDAGHLSRRDPLRARPCHHGLRVDAPVAGSVGRRADRLWAGGLLVPDGDRGARQARAGELAGARLWRRYGCRFIRPVPVLAARACADRRVFLADRAPGVRRPDAARAAAVDGACNPARRPLPGRRRPRCRSPIAKR